MTQNIEQRTEVAVKTYERSASSANEFSDTNESVFITPSGKPKKSVQGIIDDGELAVNNANEFTDTDNPTFTTPSGKTKKTVQGIIDEGMSAVSGVGGDDIGDYSSNPEVTLYNQYVVFNRDSSPTQWKVKLSVALPYKINSATHPNPQSDQNLQAFEDINKKGASEISNKANEQLLGSNIFPRDVNFNAGVGDVINESTSIRVNGRIYGMSPQPTPGSEISQIDESKLLIRFNNPPSASKLILSSVLKIDQAEVLDFNYSPIYRLVSDYINTMVTEGIIHTGQSLAEGGVGDDSVSGVNQAVYPNNALMFSPKPVGLGGDTLGTTVTGVVEPGRVTIAHSLTRNLVAFESLLNPDYTLLFSGQAQGGLPYTDIAKGTAIYNKAIAQITNAKDKFNQIKYRAITLIHGEQDGINGNTSYAANIAQLRSDYQSDIKARTGQQDNVPLFLCQTSSGSGYGFNEGIDATTFPTPLEQLKAHETNSDIYLVCPKYHLVYADHSHISNYSQRLLGEYYAKAMQTVRDSGSYEPLSPDVFTVNGNTILIKFVGVVDHLVLDTTAVKPSSDMGFSYKDNSGNTISSVTLTGTDSVTLTLSGNVGANAVVAYAYHNGDGGSSNQVAGLGDRGNLRDNDQTTSLYENKKLYNWCVTFKKEIN